MFACFELKFPLFDLLLSRKCICLHDCSHDSANLATFLVDVINLALKTPNGSLVIVSICFGLCSNCKLCDLLRGLIADLELAGSLNVED